MTTDTSTLAIRAEALSKHYGDFAAVDAISFDVKRGEIFGFLGANGAGKTTAMRMLCGLTAPTGGNAWVAGHDIRLAPEGVKQAIGYMSQKQSLYEDLTVWENIQLYGSIYGLNRAAIHARGMAALEQLGLGSHRNALLASLPLGWKQKLAFSIAQLHEPPIVFLDEPTGGVDPITRRQFWELIYAAAAHGRTVFVTTHYMDEAEYCDRVSVMVAGRIEALDTPHGLKQQFQAASMDEVFLRLARATSTTPVA